MAYTGPAKSVGYGENVGSLAEGREPGTRRRKLAGYLKAANELRQSYFSADDAGGRERFDDQGTDGVFPDASVVRSGHEEMILFPSYARRHTKSKLRAAPGTNENEQEFWRREWERHQSDSAIVDVDVRGWLYVPHRGQTTRRQRLFIGLARQMAALPAPPNARSSDPTQSSSPSRSSSPDRTLRNEEELVAREAEHIRRRGREEARYAQRGLYSENFNRSADSLSAYDPHSRNQSPVRIRHGSEGFERLSQVSIASSQDDDIRIASLQKHSSWNQPGRMTNAELVVANGHLLNRIKPFMHNPLASTPITAFFYNDVGSRQHTVYTDPSGHFTLRAALDFVPTHVRVLAGEKLSSTEEVTVTPSHGVSLISDIDDTIKHSAISAGPREIFRNAFVRELSDLSIEGVREWYTTLHDMGVKLHYVSNSPWQMYPLLTSYFKVAQLPKGSFHLKQYSGLFQGIFEPVAERKKSSLDKLMRDFPDRKFILVGDSGEADLEVYTDLALENPNRILGIFIRDVTTPTKTGYFDSSAPGAGGGRGKGSRNHSRHASGDSLSIPKRLSRPNDIQNEDADIKAAIAASLADMEEEALRARRAINPDARARTSFDGAHERDRKPKLPARRPDQHFAPETPIVASPEEDLIDFTDEPTPVQRMLTPTDQVGSTASGTTPGKRLAPSPLPPKKPQALRSPSPNPDGSTSPENRTKLPPPRPRKPSSAVKPPSPLLLNTQENQDPKPSPQPVQGQQTHQPSPLSQVTGQDSPTAADSERPPLPARPRTYRAFAKEKFVNAYNALPSARSGPQSGDVFQGPPASVGSYTESARSMSTASTKSLDDLRSENFPQARKKAPPPPPPRNKTASYSSSTTTTNNTAANRKQANRLSGGWDEDSLPGSPGEGTMGKKEYLWNQRWARAKDVLERQGVTLRTWRVGSDVADTCVKLVEMALRDIQREDRVHGVGR